MLGVARARTGARFRSRDALLAWQRKRVRSFLAQALPRVPHYGRPFRDLAELPVSTEEQQAENFAALNTLGIARDAALAASTVPEPPGGGQAQGPASPGGVPENVFAGACAGIGAVTRPYLLSTREHRAEVARLTARVLTAECARRVLRPGGTPLRVGIVATGPARLLSALPSSRIQVLEVDPAASVEDQVGQLNDWDPHVLVAPPAALVRLADARADGLLRVAPVEIVALGDVLEGADEERVRAAFPVELRRILASAEGLLAFTCHRGTLHLDEEHARFEKHWLDPDRKHFLPVVTVFTRRTQVTVRLRLDVVLRVAAQECGCRYRGLALEAMHGGLDAVLTAHRIPADASAGAEASGAQDVVRVFPEEVARALAEVGGDGAFEDWRIRQQPGVLVVRLREPRRGIERRVERALWALFADVGANAPAIRFEDWVDDGDDASLQRIRVA